VRCPPRPADNGESTARTNTVTTKSNTRTCQLQGVRTTLSIWYEGSITTRYMANANYKECVQDNKNSLRPLVSISDNKTNS